LTYKEGGINASEGRVSTNRRLVHDPGSRLGDGDLDGNGTDELLADFGEVTSLWQYDGGAWTRISDKDAQ
jgi:hypothetical protein